MTDEKTRAVLEEMRAFEKAHRLQGEGGNRSATEMADRLKRWADALEALTAQLARVEAQLSTFGAVDPEWIKRQREQGWPDMHPEDYCHRCGLPNQCWAVESREDWLAATSAWASETGREGICCFQCFTVMYREEAGKDPIWAIRRWQPEPLTVPDGDAREWLIEVLRTITPRLHEPLWTNVLGDQADAILAAFPVLSRAAEPEWEYGTAHADDPQAVRMGYTLEGAQRRVAQWNAADPERKGIVVRAPKRVWEPLPVGGDDGQ